MLKSVEFWKREDIVYRSQEFDLIPPNVLAALKPDGRVACRGLGLYAVTKN